MKKELTFSAKLDTQDFDQAIGQLQQKLRQAYSPIQIYQAQQQTSTRLQQNGVVGTMSAPSMEAFNRATQTAKREMDALITSQAQGQEKLGKIIERRVGTLKTLQEQQKEMVKNSNEELKVKERIARVEANNQQLREIYRQRDSALNQAMDSRERLNSAGGGAGGRGAGGGSGGFFGNIGGKGGFAGVVGGGLGTIGDVAQRGTEAYRDFSKGPVRTEASMGSAVSGSLGRQVGDIYGRRSAFEQMFAGERQRAAAQSLETLRANQFSDKLGMGGGLLKSIGVGMAGGAASGGLVGMFGGPIGAGAGAAIGGGLGLGKGIMDIMGNERKRSLALSPFSDTASKRYNSILAEDMVNDYSTSYEGQKKQNPFKTAAVGEYEQNWQRNLGSQRSMGLNNAGFYGPGGYQAGGIAAGFTPEMQMQMSGDILGAGGSTRMARDSKTALQFQRGTDLTNANQVMGTLSGALGGEQSTKDATIKILAEGMKLGLDDSKFAEENRKFVQMTAEIVARSGARSGDDFDRVSSGFGKFVSENTNAGLGAAKTAYDQYQQISSSTTGPRGVMRAAGFMSDPNLSKLSTITKQSLMQIPESDLNENNPIVQAAASEAGVSAKDIIGSVSKTNQGAISRNSKTDALRDKMRSYATSIGKTNLSEEDIKNAPENVQNDFNRMVTNQTAELGYKGQREATSFGLGTINQGGAGAGANGRENIINDKLTSTDRTGRMEDVTVKAMAADSKIVLDNFNEMAPAMKRAAESTAAWTREVRENAAAMQQALEAARQNKNVDTLKTVEDLMKRTAGGGNQQQNGPKSK